MKKSIRWRSSLDAYRGSELIALHFVSIDDFLTALGIRENNPECPFEVVGDLVLIVPKEAIPLFKDLKYTQEGVLDAGDVPPDKLAKLRREQGGFY